MESARAIFDFFLILQKISNGRCLLPLKLRENEEIREPFLGYLFHGRVRIHGLVFNNFFFHFPDLWVWFSKNSFIGEIFGIAGVMGMIFRKFCAVMGILLRIYRWYFYDLNGI